MLPGAAGAPHTGQGTQAGCPGGGRIPQVAQGSVSRAGRSGCPRGRGAGEIPGGTGTPHQN